MTILSQREKLFFLVLLFLFHSRKQENLIIMSSINVHDEDPNELLGVVNPKLLHLDLKHRIKLIY